MYEYNTFHNRKAKLIITFPSYYSKIAECFHWKQTTFQYLTNL